MAKDPAFLFYSYNFQSGTQFLTDERCGKYIRLLCAQHLHGHLSERQVLSICKSYDEDIINKFNKDENNLFYNERLEFEINKRKNYTASRSKNRITKKEDKENISKTYDEHMYKHMENENENINPTLEEVSKFFEDNGYINGDKAWNYYNDADWTDSTGKPVLNWKQKMRIVWFRDENKKKITLSLHDLDRRARELNEQILYPHEK